LETKGLNPNIRRDDGSLRVAALIYCQLVGTDYTHGTGVYPNLAESWTVSPDASSYTFKLRENAKWHDGQPVTADDVIWSYQKIIDEKGGSAEYINNIESMTAPDPQTLEIKLTGPDAAFLTNQGLFYGPRIMPKHLYEGTDWATNPNNDKPVGCGPFKFVEWQKGSFISFEANPDYYLGRPHLDKLFMRFYALENLISALEAGEIKFSYENFPVSVSAELAKNPKFTVDPQSVPLLYWFGFNLTKEPFDDVRVRQAFAHAINPEEVSERVFSGQLPPTRGQMPGGWAFNDQAVYEYDPEKAIQLLEEAGLTPDANGVRLRAKWTTAAVMSFPDTIAVLKEQLAKVGIEITVESMDFAAYSEKVTANKDFEIAAGGGNAGPDPAAFEPFVKTGGIRNVMSYSNAEVDELFSKARAISDQDERKAFYDQIQEILVEELPRVSYLRGSTAFPFASDVKNVYFQKEMIGKPGNYDYSFLYTYLENPNQ
jgi:peptide/nickel transport system substrate-binding protein